MMLKEKTDYESKTYMSNFSKQFELEYHLLDNWIRDNPVMIIIDKVIADPPSSIKYKRNKYGVNKVFLGTNDKDLYTMAVLRWSHLA